MKNPPIIVVHLREPLTEKDRRNRQDPFWEFGSFGLTGCHDKNLMNPEKIHELEGARLAFAQGGKGTMRLLLLTPPVKVRTHGRSQKRCELRWSPREMPFRFDHAPVLVGNDSAHSDSDFGCLKRFVKKTKRPSWVGKFSSRFRSRRKPLLNGETRQLIRVYERRRQHAEGQAICKHYAEALPEPPERRLTKAERKKQFRARRRSATRGC